MANKRIRDYETTEAIVEGDLLLLDRQNEEENAYKTIAPQTIADVAIAEAEALTQQVASALSVHENDTENPHGVTKSQVGLGSVDDTSDVDKPVSTAQAAAVDAVAEAAATAQTIASAALPKADVIDDLTTGGTTQALSAEQGKTLAAMLQTAQQASTDRGAVLNALTSQGTHYSITNLNIFVNGDGFAVGEAIGISGQSVLVDGIAVITEVNEFGGVTGLSLEKGGMFQEDISSVVVYGGSGEYLVLQAEMTETPNITLLSIPNPQPNNTALVLQDENHAGLSYIWKYVDYNGDGIFNWIVWAKASGGGDSRNFETDPIQTTEIASLAVTGSKINNNTITLAKLAPLAMIPIVADPTDYGNMIAPGLPEAFYDVFVSLFNKIKGLFLLIAETVPKTNQAGRLYGTGAHGDQVTFPTTDFQDIKDFRFYGLSYVKSTTAEPRDHVDLNMIPVFSAQADDTTALIMADGAQFMASNFKAFWTDKYGATAGTGWTPTVSGTSTRWVLSARPAGAIGIQITDINNGNKLLYRSAIPKSKNDIISDVGIVPTVKVAFSATVQQQVLKSLYECLMAIPQIAAAPAGTRFGCSLFFDGAAADDNKTIQLINAIIKDSSTQLTTLGVGSVVHTTQGCDFYRLTFNNTGDTNSYYTHISGKNFALLTNRSFQGVVKVDGTVMVG